MLIPDEVRKCVAFLYCDVNGSLRAAGTGFFVGLEEEDPYIVWVYLVTARHVVEGIRRVSSDGIVRVRLNLTQGGVHWEDVHVDRWRHDARASLAADVAVVGFAPSRDAIDFKVYPVSRFATDEVIAAQGIGIGDEVAIAGLFVNHHGSERNIPIVRIGNVAAMPEEPVKSGLGPMDAYLIEARSIGGLSGSPVFVNTVVDRSNDAANSILLTGAFRASRLHLLGVMHGHWDVAVTTEDAILHVDGSGGERVNMGIGMVVPATKILDVINGPDAQAIRALERPRVQAAGPVEPHEES